MLLRFGTVWANPDPQTWGGLQGMGQDPCMCPVLGNSCPALGTPCFGFAAWQGAGGHQELLPVLPAAPSWPCEWRSWQHQAPSCSASALRFASQSGSRALWGYWCWFWSFMGLTRCCPSAACSRSVASTLQAARSLPRVVSLAPARGRGLVSLLSPRGITHTPAGLSRSTRLHQLAGRALSHPQPCSSQLCRRLGDTRRHPGCCRRVSAVTGSKQGGRGASPCSGLAPLLACPQPGQDPRVALGRAVPYTSLLPACSPPLCGMGRAPGLATVGRETGSSVGRAQRGND